MSPPRWLGTFWAGLALAGLVTIGCLEPWLVSLPWQTPRLERPTELGFTARGELWVADHGGERVVVLESPEVARADSPPLVRPMVASDPEGARRVALEVGGVGLSLTWMVRGEGGNQAWLDPWLGVVVWAPSGQPPRTIDGWNTPIVNRLASALWYLVLGGIGLWALPRGLRGVGRWLLAGGLLGPKLALVAVPWALAGGLACGVGLLDLAREAERPARWTEMGLVARQALDAGAPRVAADHDYQIRLFRWDGEGPVPRLSGGAPAGVRAAVATGLPQARSIDGPTGHLTSVSFATHTSLPLVAEVIWDQSDTALPWGSLGLAALGAIALYGFAYAALLWVVCWIRGPQGRGSGRWIEHWGPDGLASLEGLPPARRWVSVVRWSGLAPGWETHLRLAGGWELWTLGPERTVILWGSRSEVARHCRAYQGVDRPPYRLTRLRLALGVVAGTNGLAPLVVGDRSVANRGAAP